MDAGLFAVVGVEGHRAVIVEIGIGNMDAVQLAGDDSAHSHSSGSAAATGYIPATSAPAVSPAPAAAKRSFSPRSNGLAWWDRDIDNGIVAAEELP